MNKTIAIIGVAVVIIIGGLIFYNMGNTNPSSSNNTSTPITSTNNTGDATPVQTQKPGAPIVTTNVSAAPSDTTVAVTGTVIPNGDSTRYWYEYGISSGLNNKSVSPSQTVGSGFILISAPSYITGLSKDTTYYFRLVAENQYGKVAGTQYSFQTTHGNPPPVGSTPVIKTLEANGVSRIAANLNGEITSNKASTQYWFEYGKTKNLGNATTLVSVGDEAVKLPSPLLVSGLEPLTTYYFRLNAQNQFGTVNGTILNFKTLGPSAATAPTVSTRSANSVGTSTATLRGTVDPNDAETTYWFEYSTDSLLGSVLLLSTEHTSAGTNSNVVMVETDITGLSPKTNYYFRVVAQNSVSIVRGEHMTFKTQ